MVLASASADGIDPEPFLAALTGFWLAGAVEEVSPGPEPIATAKLKLGRGGLRWLRQRLEDRA